MIRIVLKINPYFSSVINLIYPELCEYCQLESKVQGGPFCLPCLCKLPFTAYENLKQNDFTRHFEGRVQIDTGAALFHLSQGGQIEKILHRLKYEEKPQIAYNLGRFYGQILERYPNWKSADFLIPVPLHPKKQRKRGYNQSESFAKGISAEIGIPICTNVLVRKVNTSTQTKMNRVQRLFNTENSFGLINESNLLNKKIILLDDVLTTGATLEACAVQLSKISGIQISMLTIAMGGN